MIYISEILRDHAKNAEHKKYDKGIKIPAVVPIVLYNGEVKWDVEQEFRKIDEIEFLERIKVIALFFNSLTDSELIALKHWIKNTVQDNLDDSSIGILEAKKEDVERMILNNAFILTEMKEKGMKEGIQQGVEKATEDTKIQNSKNILDLLDDETIATKIEIDIEVVKRLRKESLS